MLSETLSSYRLPLFFVALTLLLLLEWLTPANHRKYKRAERWGSNFGIGALNSIIVYILIPAGAVGLAIFAEAYQIGLLYALSIDHKVTHIFIVTACVILTCPA